MSNSALVKYTKLSPNCTKPRNHAIDTITIHCMAGNCTIETCGEIFAPTSRQASSNYGVGTDGRVGLYVDEANRSWCSSNGDNDNRAVTIEVANDENKEPWHVSDKALAATIELVADICKRNGIKKLLWQGDKSLVGQTDKQNMTVHRWFANKSCPGDYLYGKHGYIADEVNKRLGATAPTPAPVTPAVATDKAIWDYLKGKGLNDYAIAGVMGNLYAESGLNPKNLQNTYEKSLGLTDDAYTAAIDSGKYTNFVKDSAGYGLAQWTYYTRKQALLDFAKAAKASIGDLTMQLNFLWKELRGYAAVINTLKTAKTVLEASNVVLLQFERPADQSATVQTKRAGYGQAYYDKYASKTAATVTPPPPVAFKPYTVKIIADTLNYRSGAGTNCPVKGTVKKGEVYTVVEEASGAGAKKWGKLKSGAGWISLDYTVKM
ncbi:hypothetical protein FACS1894208_07120 [Clostridia bacterium]|nr:hypothetical protein FACS1894208_07120 [Clostridia bacterium]